MKTLMKKDSLRRFPFFVSLIFICVFSVIFLSGCNDDSKKAPHELTSIFKSSSAEIESVENFYCNVADFRNKTEFVINRENAMSLYSMICKKFESKSEADCIKSYIGEYISLEFCEGDSSDVCHFGCFTISEDDFVCYSSGSIISYNCWYSVSRGTYSEVCDFIDGNS